MCQGSQECFERTILKRKELCTVKINAGKLTNLSFEDDSCIQKPMERTVLRR